MVGFTLQDVSREQEDLEPLREPLLQKTSNLKTEEDLGLLVNQSIDHAMDLMMQAEQLAEYVSPPPHTHTHAQAKKSPSL